MNYKIFSNDFIFENDNLTKVNINVTSMNKKTILTGNNYRKFNILLGDLVTDCDMETNMNIEDSVRIGFLDIDKKELLDHYKKHFDIVILGEGDY